MFNLQFYISGMMVYSAHASSVPALGSEIVFRTEAYKKGMGAGTVLKFKLGESILPISYDFTESPPIVYIDVDNYEVITEGSVPD